MSFKLVIKQICKKYILLIKTCVFHILKDTDLYILIYKKFMSHEIINNEIKTNKRSLGVKIY